MFRIVGFAFLVAIVASIVSNGNGTVVAIAFFGVLALFVFSLVTGRTVLKCPNCGKRVKLGYSTCHHCGAQVANPRALGAPKFAPEEIAKECDHCRTLIPPEASVCPQCRRDVTPWTFHDGTWWQGSEGNWQRLNLHTDPPSWEPFVEPERATAES